MIDSVLIPSSVAAGSSQSPSGKARNLIELAVRRGAPMYNDGNQVACVAIYEVAAYGLLAMSDDAIGEHALRRMEARLGKLDEHHDTNSRAWELRHMLDDVYRSLGEN